MEELRHGRVDAWGSCGVGVLGCWGVAVGDFQCRGVAVWGNWDVGKLRFGGAAVWGNCSGGYCGVWGLRRYQTLIYCVFGIFHVFNVFH